MPKSKSRGLRALILMLAVGLVPAGATLALLERKARADARQDLDRDLMRQADLEAVALENYFERARASVLIAAQNSAFTGFYTRPGGRIEKIRAKGPEIVAANASLGHLETIYPDSIGEACFIDAGGAENARVVRGEVAPLDDLSPDETEAPFFAPSLALPVGQVHQARPYVSPDTKEWVISNSTPIAVPGRGKVAVVHFEVTIESFRKAALTRIGRFDLAIVDARTGAVVIDSHLPQRVGAPLGQPGTGSMRRVIGYTESSGLVDLDEGRAAFRRLSPTRGNANDWIVVAVASSAQGSLLAGVGAWPFALLTLALLLAAILASRRWRRVTNDLDEVAARRDALQREALTDSLTGVGNHRAFYERLAGEAAARAQHGHAPLTLAMLDLDDLKITNDRLGHRAGDARLTEVAGALRGSLPPGGEVFRIGGDEFAVLLPARHSLDAVALVGLVRAPRQDGSGSLGIDVTAGVAELEADMEVSELARRADQALLEAKRAHRGVVTYTPEIGDAAGSTDRPSLGAVTLATALARAVDAKDAYTRSHCETVAEACVLIGRELGLEGARLERLRLAGLLHDVGKIGTPDRILQKPGALTDEEFEVMKRHVTLGYRILLGADLLEEAEWVLHHHERVDGRGYPDGLVGSEIPLESRIVLVADAFEAMTSDRPYRKGVPVGDALTELRVNAGTQFCPTCVAAFCRAVEGTSATLVPASLRLQAEVAQAP